MIILSLHRFKGCGGKHILVDEAMSSPSQGVVGRVCSTSGDVHVYSPDEHIVGMTEYIVTDPERLQPTGFESKAWLEQFIKDRKDP